MDDRTKLLNSLAIDREKPRARRTPQLQRLRPGWTLATLGAFVIAGAALWFVLPSDEAGRAAAVSTASAEPTLRAAAPEHSAVSRARSGGLAASG
jgi:hypothetical protein